MKKYLVFLSIIVIFIFCVGAFTSSGTAQSPQLEETLDGRGWKQVNLSGFANPNTVAITALEVFNDLLYASTGNSAIGGQVWRSSDGTDWIPVSEVGFSGNYTNTNVYIPDLVEFKGQLYAGTSWSNSGDPGQIWRTQNGTTWQPVIEDGFNNPANTGITTFTVFSDTLYAATTNPTEGLEIWRSPDGESGNWDQVVDAGSGYPTINGLTGFTSFEGYLYAAVEAWQTGGTCQVWRTDDGTNWEHVITDGFGDSGNISMGGFAILDGFLYVGTYNDETGAQLWYSDDGTIWDSVTLDGFGDPNNIAFQSLSTFDGYLFAVIQNPVDGLGVWRSPDGSAWSQVASNGFGNVNNYGSLWSNGTMVFQDRLYIGTINQIDGGEIWRLGYQTYLPLTER